MGKKPVQPEDKYVLRLPDGMRDRIKEAAERNNRSMNAEIVARLEEYSMLSGKAKAFDNANREIYRQALDIKDLQEQLKEIDKLRLELAREQGRTAALRQTLRVFMKHMIRDGTEELAKAIAIELNPDTPAWEKDDEE